MAAEDVGFGDRGLPAVIEALHAQRSRIPRGGERWLLAVHAVRLLVAAPKDRTSAELSDWAQLVVDSGRRGAEVIDVAVDMHTERGVGMAAATRTSTAKATWSRTRFPSVTSPGCRHYASHMARAVLRAGQTSNARSATGAAAGRLAGWPLIALRPPLLTAQTS